MTVLGLPLVLANLNRIGAQIEKAKSLKDAAEIIREAWVGNIVGDDLILTGAYRDSITIHEHGPDLISISSDDVPYAPFLEYGTSTIPAHFVATRASDESHDAVVEAVGKSVRTSIR